MTTKELDGGVTDHAESEIRSDGSACTAVAVAARLQAVEQMDYAGLVREWRRLYRAHPPKRVARDLLMLGVAWKIQEQV